MSRRQVPCVLVTPHPSPQGSAPSHNAGPCLLGLSPGCHSPYLPPLLLPMPLPQPVQAQGAMLASLCLYREAGHLCGRGVNLGPTVLKLQQQLQPGPATVVGCYPGIWCESWSWGQLLTVPLSPPSHCGQASGTWQDLTARDAHMLLQNELFLNVATKDFEEGELRGQISSLLYSGLLARYAGTRALCHRIGGAPRPAPGMGWCCAPST